MPRTRRIYGCNEISMHGSERETALFKQYGFEPTHDCLGRFYYLDTMGNIIELYLDGTWRPGEAHLDPNASLQYYLDLTAQVLELAHA